MEKWITKIHDGRIIMPDDIAINFGLDGMMNDAIGIMDVT